MKCVWIFTLMFGVTSASMKTLLHSDLRTVAKSFLEGSETTSRCRRDLFHLAMSANEPWALKMLDSFGKPGSGLMSGNIRWTGNRNQCSKIRSVEKLSSEKSHGQRVFSGKHCWLHWKNLFLANLSMPILSLPLQSGACIPNTCSAQDILETYPLFQTLLGRYKTLKGIFSKDIILNRVECLDDSSHSINSAMKISYFIMALLLFLTVASPALIYIFTKKTKLETGVGYGGQGHGHKVRIQSLPVKILSCFSAIHHCTSLLNMDQTENKLEFLNGIRVLSFCWVLIGHGQLHILPTERTILRHTADAPTPGYQFLHHGFFAVDTFFFMGAFILTFGLLKNSTFRLNLKTSLFLILNRYLRVAPVMLLVFPFINYAGMFLDKNPSGWRLGDPWKACSSSWWTFPLLLNNFSGLNPDCGSSYWYLALDFQLFVISIPIIMLIKRSRVQGKVVTLSAIFSTLLISVYIVYSKNIGTFYDYLILSTTKVREFIERHNFTHREYHSIPQARGFSYFCGILFALNVSKRTTARRNSILPCVFQLILSLAAFLFVILGPVYIERNELGNAVFIPLLKVSWVFGVALIFNICLKYPNFFVSRFLSWRGWKPLAKLTFSSYLLHSALMDVVFYSNDQFYTYSRKNLNTMVLGVLIASYAAAFVFSIIAEAPVIKLGKLLMSKD